MALIVLIFAQEIIFSSERRGVFFTLKKILTAGNRDVHFYKAKWVDLLKHLKKNVINWIQSTFLRYWETDEYFLSHVTHFILFS